MYELMKIRVDDECVKIISGIRELVHDQLLTMLKLSNHSEYMSAVKNNFAIQQLSQTTATMTGCFYMGLSS
jgi:hypothetical protein